MDAAISAPGEAALSVHVAEWAAGNPKVRRVWEIQGNGQPPPASGPDVALALELQPVADSEETLVAWMANCGKWRRELQSRIGRLTRLEWIDPDGARGAMPQEPNERRVLLYERAG
jgi:hypothetical protein